MSVRELQEKGKTHKYVAHVWEKLIQGIRQMIPPEVLEQVILVGLFMLVEGIEFDTGLAWEKLLFGVLGLQETPVLGTRPIFRLGDVDPLDKKLVIELLFQTRKRALGNGRLRDKADRRSRDGWGGRYALPTSIAGLHLDKRGAGGWATGAR